MTRKRKEDELVTPHFKWSELCCPCCERLEMPQAALDFIERVRNRIGKPMKLNSAYRCLAYNVSARVRGKPNSPHVKGLAFDIHIPSDKYRFMVLEAGILCGAKGIGVYPNMVHLDIDESRPTKRTSWVDIPPAQK